MRVFLSAADGDANRFVSSILREFGVEVVDAFSIAPGAPLENSLCDHVGSTDLYLGLLRAPADWQMYEMGIASALEKPIAVIADPSFQVPAVVKPVFFIQSPLSDERLIRSFLEKVTSDLRKTVTPSSHPTVGNVGRDKLRSLLSRAQELRKSNKIGASEAFSMERLVFDLLKETGLIYAANTEHSSQGLKFEADAIVHVPSIAHLLGSSLLIEVKIGPMGRQRVKETFNKVRKHLNVLGWMTAVVFYLDPLGKKIPAWSATKHQILAFDIEDFIVEMMDYSFEKVLIRARNRAVHGS